MNKYKGSYPSRQIKSTISVDIEWERSLFLSHSQRIISIANQINSWTALNVIVSYLLSVVSLFDT